MGPDAASDADINFHFDPLCSFTRMTNKCAQRGAARGDPALDWRFISLRMTNADVNVREVA
jgi:hypothetical protein